MRAEDKGNVCDGATLFDLLGTLGEVRAQGFDIRKLGISREVLTGLVKAAVERDKITVIGIPELRTQLETVKEWQKIAKPPDSITRPDADTDP